MCKVNFDREHSRCFRANVSFTEYKSADFCLLLWLVVTITFVLQIIKVPVQSCHLKTDCHSCISMKDPYCGWCVLEGRWVCVVLYPFPSQKQQQGLQVFIGPSVPGFVSTNQKCLGPPQSSWSFWDFCGGGQITPGLNVDHNSSSDSLVPAESSCIRNVALCLRVAFW